jgi:hypothetical protein
MARGRLVSRTLGSSRKFAALQQTAGRLAEFAQTLYPLLVANSDDYGRMAGDAFTVKHAVFPTSKRKEAEFRDALVAMHNACLIALYEAEGQLIIQIQQFDEHQPGLSKRTKSRFPELPVNFTGAPGISNAIELNRTEFKGTEPNRTEPKRKDQNLPAPKSRRDARPVENPEGAESCIEDPSTSPALGTKSRSAIRPSLTAGSGSSPAKLESAGKSSAPSTLPIRSTSTVKSAHYMTDSDTFGSRANGIGLSLTSSNGPNGALKAGSDDVSPALCDQSGDPGEGAGDAGCGVESPDQGTDVSSRLRVSPAGDAVAGDECRTGGARTGAWTEAVDLAAIRSAADPDHIEAGKLEARAKRQAFRERAGGAPGSVGAHPLIETLRTSLKETRH